MSEANTNNTKNIVISQGMQIQLEDDQKVEETQDYQDLQDEITTELIKCFPAGYAKDVVVDKLIKFYNVDRNMAETCYENALSEVARKQNLSKEKIQKGEITNDKTKKTSASEMNGLVSMAAFQRAMLETGSISKEIRNLDSNGDEKDELGSMDTSTGAKGGD